MVSQRGMFITTAAGCAFSIGGAVSRFIHVSEPWAVVFWRGLFAGLFMLFFMLGRYRLSGLYSRLLKLGLPGLLIALTTAISLTLFVVALFYTTVANVVLLCAGAPVIAALMVFIFYGEKTPASTWVAIVAVGLGVVVMVSGGNGGGAQGERYPQETLGLIMAFGIAVCTAVIAVFTRRHHHIAMIPATMLGCLFAAAFGLAVLLHKGVGIVAAPVDMIWLMVFGVVNLGLGMTLFVSGAKSIPAAMTTLILLIEPVFGPVWVWLIHGEVPASSTLIGGAIILGALFVHIFWQARSRPALAEIA